MKDLKKRKHLPEGSVLIFGFLMLIFVGSILLFLPFSNRFERLDGARYLDCLFTSTSCVCVTGLSTVTVSQNFTIFGQAVMLLLIQLGGLGFMTAAILLSRIVRRRITPKEQLVAAQALGFEVGENLRTLLYSVIRRALIIEAAGALLLSAQMWRYAANPLQAAWFSVFHSVSAFCNAGFDLFCFEQGSITGMSDNTYILIVLMLLITIGGIGFMVWDDLISRAKDRFNKLSVYTKFILICSFILFVLQAALTFFFEKDNPLTLGGMTTGKKIVNACFHSVSLRTAGFASVSNAAFSDATKLSGAIMMFIGGCSGSTAGGVKVGTVGLILFAVGRYSFGKKNLNIGGRSIDSHFVLRAMSLFFIGLLIVLFGTGLVSALEKKPLIDLMYETVSAFGTVGLSADVTPTLGVFTKLFIMLLMYFGRVGILTITNLFTARSAENDYGIRYPSTSFYIG